MPTVEELKNLEDWQRRVIDEKAALDGTIFRLDKFLRSDASETSSDDTIKLMVEQRYHMEEYSHTLEERIKGFFDGG